MFASTAQIFVIIWKNWKLFKHFRKKNCFFSIIHKIIAKFKIIFNQ